MRPLGRNLSPSELVFGAHPLFLAALVLQVGWPGGAWPQKPRSCEGSMWMNGNWSPLSLVVGMPLEDWELPDQDEPVCDCRCVLCESTCSARPKYQEWQLHAPGCAGCLATPEPCVGCDTPGWHPNKILPRGPCPCEARWKGWTRGLGAADPLESRNPGVQEASQRTPPLEQEASPEEEVQPPEPEEPAEPALKKLRGEGSSISVHLAAGKLSGCVLEHCIQHIQGILRQPRTFKIGLTRDPELRWTNRRYGYQHLQTCSGRPVYHSMHVLAETETAEGAALLEAALIEKFTSRSGCMNRARGGEGLRGCSLGHYFVYLVHGWPS